MNWLFELSLFITAAVIGGEICKKLKISPLIGEITAGLIFSAIFLTLSVHHDHHVLTVFAELGVIFILFVIGLETNLNQILSVSKPAFSVAFAGVVLPFASGILLGKYYGWPTPVTLFVASSLVATSITVSARAFMDLNFVKDRSSQIVLGAAIIDDILGLLVLTFVLTTVDAGNNSITWKLTQISLFFIIALPAVWFFLPKGLNAIGNRIGMEAKEILTIAFLLFLSFVSHWCGLAPIVGAFFLGLVLAGLRHENLMRIVHPFYLILAPLFFFSIGFMVDVTAFVDGLGLAVILTIVAIVSKALGGFLGAMPLKIPFKESLLIGVAMVPRGEVGLIIVGIGKTMGIVNDTVFAATAFMCLATTMIPPLLLPTLIKLVKKDKERSALVHENT